MTNDKWQVQRAFTLVELMIVVAIIAILVTIAIMYLRGQLFKGNDARRKADINRIKVAVEEYEKDHNCYPPIALMTCNPGIGLKPYLDKIPCDPTTHDSYPYDYDDIACPSWYRIFAYLENQDDSSISGFSSGGSGGSGGSYNYCTGSPNSPSCNLIETGNFYGCKGGYCVPILWDQSRPGPECDPNYQSPTCYGQCVSESAKCKPWGQ